MKSLNIALSILIFLGLGLLSSSCDKKGPPTETAKSTKVEPKAVKVADKKIENGNTGSDKAKAITVAKTGTKFDPSIKPSELPDDAWACVMGGKVHYARMEKGDGKCEICKMNLSQPNLAEAPKDDHAHGDHKH